MFNIKALITVISLTLLISGLHAQNFVTSGDFTNGIQGWDNQYENLVWVNDDGAISNGSAEIRTEFNNGGSSTARYIDIIPVIQGETYELSAAMKVMPDTEAVNAVVLIEWLNENEMAVGFTDYLYSNSDVADGTWHNVSERFTPPEAMKYAKILVGVRTENSGSTALSAARIDDVRFTVADAENFLIVGGHSGSWYNPDQSGHGLNIEILPNNRAQIYWYTYDNQRNSMWLVGSGEHDGQEIVVDVGTANGALFPPEFMSGDVSLTLWGEFSVSFTGCNEGVFKWTPAAGSQFTAGEMTINRLTALKGQNCSE